MKQIGVNIGRKGMPDEEIVTLLHGLRNPTFFTRDSDFYDRLLCDSKYCLVYLSVDKTEAASFVRRFLHHPDFKTHRNRMGKAIRTFERGHFILAAASIERSAGQMGMTQMLIIVRSVIASRWQLSATPQEY